MNKSNLLFKILLGAFYLIAGITDVTASNSDLFVSQSKLAEGKWIKIRVRENGIYELTYDQLREMGFTNPESVGIYGKGGKQMSEKFIDSKGDNYIDDLPPVAVLHKDNKIYFYGQGPVSIRYRSELSNPVNRRFLRESLNTYSEYGYYFLSEGRDDVLHIPMATGSVDYSRPDLTECYDYFYHELEQRNFCLSGRLFVGESFIDKQDRSQAIDYSIPGALEGSASLECRFYAANPAGSTMTYGVDENDLVAAKVGAPKENYYAESCSPSYSEVTLPSSSGKIYINYSPNGTPTHAYLDYLLLGAKKKIAFTGDEAQFRAFLPYYSTAQYGLITIDNAPETVMVWDVENSNSIKQLPHEYVEGVAKAKYLTTSKKDGMMMVFDTEKEQMKIDWWEEAYNQNLHGISKEDVPDLLIITVPYLHEKAEALADIHRIHDGMDVLVVDSPEVINEFGSGTPDAMAYRALCKMLYDRNSTKFKNLLLFGVMHYDNRQILSNEKSERLLSYQTDESINSVMTFCISDFFGMLEDTPSTKGMQYDIVNIGVGELPCQSLHDADIIIDKVARYTLDTSFAYWIGNMQVTADGPDNNEHLTQAETLATEISAITDNEHTISKVYVSAMSKEQIKNKMLHNLNEGLLYGSYLGHASSGSLSSNFSVWTTVDAQKLKNDRLAFMSFGACSVTSPDLGVRGSTEAMVFANKHGLVGGLMTSRTAYSYWNYLMLSCFQQCMLQQEQSADLSPDISKPRISERKTIGEVYALAKSNMQVPHNNEFVYHLISDPAIVLPIATTAVEASIDTDTTDESGITLLQPGKQYTLHGKITDRKGAHLSNFNGSVVVRIYDKPSTIKTNGYGNSPAVDIMYDETLLNMLAMDVVNGEFSTDFIMPTSMEGSESGYAKIRLAAYDATQRIGSTGVIEIAYDNYDPEQAEIDNQAPIIESMYLNSDSFIDGDNVGKDFILHADITDEIGVRTTSSNFTGIMYLQLDGRTTFDKASQYVTLSDGGKKCHIAYPMNDIPFGSHTLTLYTSDLTGNSSSRSIAFRVVDNGISGKVIIHSLPAREDAEIEVRCDATTTDIAKTLVVADSFGKTVYSASVQGDTLTWDLKRNNGEHVAPGIYSVYCKFDGGHILKGVSQSENLIVIK